MKEQVKLSIKTKQIPHGPDGGVHEGQDVSTYETTASYFQKENSHYLMYEEVLDGYKDPFRTRLKLKDGSLEINRAGSIRQRMLFEQGNVYCMDYVTPYGTFVLEMRTKMLSVFHGEEELTVVAEYDIFSEGQKVSENRIEIRAK